MVSPVPGHLSPNLWTSSIRQLVLESAACANLRCKASGSKRAYPPKLSSSSFRTKYRNPSNPGKRLHRSEDHQRFGKAQPER